jgi:hypothetical protein
MGFVGCSGRNVDTKYFNHYIQQTKSECEDKEGETMKIQMNKVLVKKHETMSYEYKKDFIEFELVDPLSYCCSTMKEYLSSEHGSSFDTERASLDIVFTIDNGDYADTYEFYQFNFCPFCGERLDYEIVGEYVDTPVYKDAEVYENQRVLVKKKIFDKLERTRMKK